MIWLLLILDILIYNFTSYSSYFFIISICLCDKKDLYKLILIGLFLDLIVFDKLFINTLIIWIIFLINKKFFKLKEKTLISFLLINNFNFLLYNIFLAFLTVNFDVLNFFESLMINIIFYLLSYNLLKKHIKLSRW